MGNRQPTGLKEILSQFPKLAGTWQSMDWAEHLGLYGLRRGGECVVQLRQALRAEETAGGRSDSG
jgi:hypothetical protein